MSTAGVACTDDDKNGMLIFGGVELTRKDGGGGSEYKSIGKEKFVGLRGCEFFKRVGDQDIYLHKLGFGPGTKGNLFVLGDETGVFDLGRKLGSSGTGKTRGVALIGVVGDVLGFIGEKKLNHAEGIINVPDCFYNAKSNANEDRCNKYNERHKKKNGQVDREWQARKGYTKIYQKFNRAALQNEHRFGDWLLNKAKQGGWFPKGTAQIKLDEGERGQEKPERIILLRKAETMTSGDALNSGFYSLLGGANGLKVNQRWSKTAVMRHEQIKELGKEL